MKVAAVSSLWGYINYALLLNSPRSLFADDAFAVLAYLLSIVEIFPNDFVLLDVNITKVKKECPSGSIFAIPKLKKSET